jgi:hypothetical protein
MTVTSRTKDLVNDFVEQAGLVDAMTSQGRLTPPNRELHRRVLHAFLEDGAAPSGESPSSQARDLGLDPSESLAELDRRDLVHLANDVVAVAYPFSGIPTAHRVQLEDGPPLYAMCAVDALGIPLMAGRSGLVASTDPQTGEGVRVELRNGSWSWEPEGTVVVAAGATGCSTAAEGACGTINFHANTANADAYLTEHPELFGLVLDQQTAVEAAEMVFGALLGDG